MCIAEVSKYIDYSSKTSEHQNFVIEKYTEVQLMRDHIQVAGNCGLKLGVGGH